MVERLQSIRNRIKLRERYRNALSSRRYKNTVRYVQRKPFTSFLIALGLLLLVMILGSVLNNLKKKETPTPILTKDVRTYNIGKAPTITLQAQIENNGVVQIVAQTSGIVQSINALEGESVHQGKSLISLSSNYQGGNAPALQAQLAGTQLKNTNETYVLQQDILSAQRTVATASAENTEQLRQISDRSLGETRDLLSLNEGLLNNLLDQIEAIETANPNDPTLPGLRSQQAGLQSGVIQLRGTVRGVEYSTNQQNPPTTLSLAQKDIALKGLDVQEKALQLGREVSRIQYNLALVQAGMMNPSSPLKGTVERIHVKEGQNVSPGDILATVSANDLNSTAIVRAPRDIARSVSQVEPSTFLIGGKSIKVLPSYVSSVATDGQLYSIIYALPDGVTGSLTDRSYMSVEVPVGYANTNSVIPFIPIDSVYESQNESTVYLVQKGVAVSRKVEIGQVYGQFIEVKNGLKNGDIVILNRNVIAGDKVSAGKPEQNEIKNAPSLKY